jgi:hypothetical protein
MKTEKVTELTTSEMEAISGGVAQNGTHRPRLGKLIVFLLLLLLLKKKRQDSAPMMESVPAA